MIVMIIIIFIIIVIFIIMINIIIIINILITIITVDVEFVISLNAFMQCCWLLLFYFKYINNTLNTKQ